MAAVPERAAWEVDSGLPVERYRCRVLLLVFSLTLQLLTLGERWGAPDERERVMAAEQLIDQGTLRLKHGGHTKYPPLTSVLLVPGVLLKRTMPGHHDAWLMVPSVVAGAACVLPFQRALWAIGVPLGGSVVATALFAAANPVWPYTKRLYSEPFTAFFVLCAFAAALGYRAQRRRLSLILAWLCLAGAVGNNSVVLVLIPVLAGLLALRGRRDVDAPAAVVSLAAGTLTVGAWLLINHLKFGGAFNTGYADTGTPNDVFDGETGFTTPLYVGLWGLLFSAGRGLVVHAPLALLGAWALWSLRDRWRGAALYLLLAGTVPLLVYSTWWSWHGGTCYGPRLLTPFLGLWMLGLGPLVVDLRARLVGGPALRVGLALAAALNIVAMFAGTLFLFSFDQQFWLRDRPFNDFLDVYTPQFAPLPRSLRNAMLFPEGMNLLWLDAETRPPWEITAPSPEAHTLEVRLRHRALRDTWEIAEIIGVTTDGREVSPSVVTAHSVPGVEVMADGNPNSVWLGGTQRAGQWVRVDFGPQSRLSKVIFIHGKKGEAYPRFPSVKFGNRPVIDDARVPVGDLDWRWPGWLLLLCLLASLRGIQRWSGAGPWARPLSAQERPG